MSFQLRLATAPGGNPSTGTVTLSEPAPPGGAAITLTSEDPTLAAAPERVTVPAGRTVAHFWVRTSVVSIPRAITLTATGLGSTWTESLRVVPPSAATLTIEPGTVYGGDPATATVTLDGTSPPGGTVVTLSSSQPEAGAVPERLTIPARESTVTFPIRTQAVDGLSPIMITAAAGETRVTETLSLHPAGVISIDLGAATVVGGFETTGTVTLRGPIPERGAKVDLTSDNPAVAVEVDGFDIPRTLKLRLRTRVVTRAERVTITAAQGSTRQSATLTVMPDILTFGVNPERTIGGTPVTGTITLRGPAPAGGAAILLTVRGSGSPPPAAAPVRVIIPEGESSITVPITTSAVRENTGVAIEATYHQQKLATSLLLLASGVKAILLDQPSVAGGQRASGSVQLHYPATAPDLVVSLTCDQPALATVPERITIPSGKEYAGFEIVTRPVGRPTQIRISGSAGGERRSATLTLLPAGLGFLALPETPVTSGQVVMGTVFMNATVVGEPAVVPLSSTDPAVELPAAVTVPAGASSASFPVQARDVAAPTELEVIARYGGEHRIARLYIVPRYRVSLALASPAVTGGRLAVGIITLNAPALRSGLSLTVASGNPALASTPSTVFLGSGSSRSSFVIATSPVETPTSVEIRVTLPGEVGSAAAALTVLPPPLSAVRLDPKSLPGGGTAEGTILFNPPAPEGGAVVRLATDNPAAATVPPSVRVPAGASSVTFRVTTYRVATATPVTVRATWAGIARTAVLTVLPTPIESRRARPYRRSSARPRQSGSTFDIAEVWLSPPWRKSSQRLSRCGSPDPGARLRPHPVPEHGRYVDEPTRAETDDQAADRAALSS
jgi:hypothetical protein